MRARTRAIAPSYFSDERLYQLEAESGLPVRVAFLGIKSVTDREGRFSWNPAALKLHALPYDPCDMTSVLEALRARLFVVRYVVGSAVCGWVPSWSEDAQINPRESPSELPAPPDWLVIAYQRAMQQVMSMQGFPVGGQLDMLRSEPMGPMEQTISVAISDTAPRIDRTSAILPSGLTRQPRVSAASGTRQDCENPSELPSRNGANPADSESNSDSVSEETGDAGAPEKSSLSLSDSLSLSNRGIRQGEMISVVQDSNALNSLSTTERASPYLEILSRESARASGEAIGDAESAQVRQVDVDDDGPAHALPAIRGPKTYEAIVRRVAQVMEEVQNGRRTSMRREQQRQLMAGIVFAYWIAKSGRDAARTRLDDKRESLIMRRLEEGGDDLSEALYAVDGSQRDANLVKNENGRYDTIEYIFRDRGHIERLAEKMKGHLSSKPHGMVQKYRAILTDDAGAAE